MTVSTPFPALSLADWAAEIFNLEVLGAQYCTTSVVDLTEHAIPFSSSSGLTPESSLQAE